MENSKEIPEWGGEKSRTNSISGSPNNSKVNSPAKSTMTNSPAKLSDYSPLKGPKAISSFFTPPIPVKSTFLSASPQKATSFSSPIATNSSNLKKQTQLSSEDSGSDLILSEEEESEIEAVEAVEVKNSTEEAEESEEEVSFKPTLTRGIPFLLNEGEDEEEETEVEDHKEPAKDNKSESDSDISVIISLPSTDSNDQVTATRRYTDMSNSEYESLISDEEETENNEILLIDGSEDESEKIPVMLFSSNQINIQSSPEKNQISPQIRPVVPPPAPVEMPEKKIAPKRPFEENIDIIKVPLTKPVLPESENQPPSPKKRSAEVFRITEAFIQSRTTVPAATLQPVVQPVPLMPQSNGPVTRISTNHIAQPDQQFTRPPAAAAAPIKQAQTVPAVTTASNHQSSNRSQFKTGYVYDERMLHHFDPHDPEHPEKPARLTSIYEKLRSAKLLEKSYRLPLQIKLNEFAPEVQSIHDTKYCRMINNTSLIRNIDELNQISSQFNSVYMNPSTAISATVAAAATIELCQAIGRGDIENGFAIVRPPGHHAEHDEAMGFCIYNNVAVAASSLLRKGLARKILILDWDVHHGNGTQNAFAESGDVLYVSIHRYDGAKFYPHIEEANYTYVGAGTAGLGKSVNVAWNGPGYGDADYLYAFSRLIMPIAREYNPDFVIVSAGFDAAAGDPIGECELTTYGYSIMLQELMQLAGGKVALVLEGGYNLEVISKCYEACVRMLLKESAPLAPGPMVASAKAIFAVESTLNSQSSYWRCLFPKAANISVKTGPNIPLPTILDQFWREECKNKFNLTPIPGLFNMCSDSFIQKYSNRVLASNSALFNPEVLIIFAHESGPIHSTSFISSHCIQPSKLCQSQPFMTLIRNIAEQAKNYSLIDINLPTRSWKLKQTQIGNEVESQELNVLFTLLWDRLISRSECKNVFFIAAGSPIYAIGNLINMRSIETQVRGCFFFSSSLFIPIINAARSTWYQRNSHVVVPSQEPVKKAIGSAPPGFGSCFSSGQLLMPDSSAAVGEFLSEILNFIRSRLQRP